MRISTASVASLACLFTQNEVSAFSIGMNGSNTRSATRLYATAAPEAAVNGSSQKTSTPPKIRLNVPEKARTVISVCTSGTLCTASHMDDIQGAPFGSFVDYVLDDKGNPVLLMNEMSMHTVNIQKSGPEGLVTLFAQLGGPTSSSGVVSKKIYYVGGFGVSSEWVPPEEYSEATPDILAKDASGIMTRLNRDHAEDLMLTATQILEVKEVDKVRVTGVDRLGMDMRVTCRDPRRKSKLITDEFRVGFRIPVISVEDAKSEVLKVFQEAWEKKNGVTWGDDAVPGADIPMLKTAEDSLM
eukprot:g3389.t1 g3389   contig12:1981623-1982680(-)